MKIIKYLVVSSLVAIVVLCPSNCSSTTGSFQLERPHYDSARARSSWRLTKHGWQDSSTWYVDKFKPQTNLELVHPLILATLELLLVVTAMIWASNEWEIARLFNKPADSSETEEPASESESELPR